MTRDSIRALVEAATPGPWTADMWPDGVPYVKTGPEDEEDVVADWAVMALDAEFIAASRTAVPLLLAVADAAAALRDHHADVSCAGLWPRQCKDAHERLVDALAALEAVR